MPDVRVYLCGDVSAPDVEALARDLRRLRLPPSLVALDLDAATCVDGLAVAGLHELAGRRRRAAADFTLVARGAVLRRLDESGLFREDGGPVALVERPSVQPDAARLVAGFYGALQRDDWSSIRALLAPDAVWRTPAMGSAGVHEGADAVVAFLRRPMPEPKSTRPDRMVWVDGEVRVRGVHRDRRTLAHPVAFRHTWQAAHGHLTSLIEQIDAGAHLESVGAAAHRPPVT